jgi:type II secretory pathway component PulF
MDSITDIVIFLLEVVGVLSLLGIGIAVLGGALFLIHFLLTLPMRRAERARMFLDLIENAVKQGQPVEETLISISQSRDQSMGARFHLLAAWLEQNPRLGDALAKVPGFLPPQVTAMLKAGQKIGDLRKVLPACRPLLQDAVSQTRAAINYLVILTFVITPLGIWVFGVLKVCVLPKFNDIAASYGGLVDLPTGYEFILAHGLAFIAVQFVLLLLLWLAAFIYFGGPRLAAWFPVLQRLYFFLPWRRKRMQRDFSTMLAILLDSGVPEPEAVGLAGDCTANLVFRQRAACAVAALQQGMKLTQAVQTMDDSGEFGWRLTNAFHGRGGFLQALAGWHESLDAKAFQQEQAAAHGITSALVFWNGLFVGAIVISVFLCLVSFLDSALLW